MRILVVLVIAIFVELGISLPQSQSISELMVRDQVGAIDDSDTFDPGIDEAGLGNEQSPIEITENTELLVGDGLGRDLVSQTSDETNSAALETDCSSDHGPGVSKKRSNPQCSAQPESQTFQLNQKSGSTPNLPPNKKSKKIKKKGNGNGEPTKSPSLDQSTKSDGLPGGDYCPASKVPLTRPLCCSGQPMTLGTMVVGCTPCRSLFLFSGFSWYYVSSSQWSSG